MYSGEKNVLYVGNLSPNVTEDQLRGLFSQVEETTDLTLIVDRNTGISKGFAFVRMTTEEGAKEAIRRFHGNSLDNRMMSVFKVLTTPIDPPDLSS